LIQNSRWTAVSKMAILPHMSTEQFKIHLVRTDTKRNMARYYHLSLEPSLFGDYSVLQNWGRLGTHGQVRVALYVDRRSAMEHFLDITKKKKARGYRPRSTFEAAAEYANR
jgi:predicted DNA-binding WGR domain protein